MTKNDKNEIFVMKIEINKHLHGFEYLNKVLTLCIFYARLCYNTVIL